MRKWIVVSAAMLCLLQGCAKSVVGTYKADTQRWGYMRFREDGQAEIMNYKRMVIHTLPYVIEGDVIKVSSPLTTQAYKIHPDGTLTSLDPNYPTATFTPE